MPEYGLHIPFETVLGLIPGTLENKKRRLEAARAEEAQKLVPLEALWLQQGFKAMHPNLLKQEEVLGGLSLQREGLGLQREGLELQKQRQASEELLKRQELELERDRLGVEKAYRLGLIDQAEKELALRNLQQTREAQRWGEQLAHLKDELQVRRLLGLLDALGQYRMPTQSIPWVSDVQRYILKQLGIDVKEEPTQGLKKVFQMTPEQEARIKELLEQYTREARGDKWVPVPTR